MQILGRIVSEVFSGLVLYLVHNIMDQIGRQEKAAMKLLRQLASAKKQINSQDTSSFLKELEPGELRSLQNTLLEMLIDIVCVCKTHGIQVFLLGGTALGAVRHKGFIPWDDDVDIGMPRDDYNRFIPFFEQELSDKYLLNAPNYSTNAIARFPKILKKDSYMDTGGIADESLRRVYIDIFLADRIPESAVMRGWKTLRCNFMEFVAGQVYIMSSPDEVTKRLYQSGARVSYTFRRLLAKMFSFRSTSQWYDKIDRAVQYKKNSSLWGLPTGSRHYNGEVFSKDVFLPAQCGEFEGNEVPLPHDADRYLTNLYGDYMQIPPPEKRQRHFVRELRL